MHVCTVQKKSCSLDWTIWWQMKSLQFTVRGSDQRIPERTDTAEVQINVLRDTFPPIFVQEPYATSISENTINGTSVYRVTATDQDLKVGIYIITRQVPYSYQFVCPSLCPSYRDRRQILGSKGQVSLRGALCRTLCVGFLVSTITLSKSTKR